MLLFIMENPQKLMKTTSDWTSHLKSDETFLLLKMWRPNEQNQPKKWKDEYKFNS